MSKSEPKSLVGYGQYYIDRYGQIWKRINDNTVWSPRSGYGTWDNGNGLVLLSKEGV